MPLDSNDRLSLALSMAAIAHGFLLLGIGFTVELLPVPERDSSPLEVVLVQQRSLDPPADAKLLAQADLRGGGTLEQPDLTPESAAPALFPADQPALTAPPVPEQPAPAPEQPQPETAAASQALQDHEELLTRPDPEQPRVSQPVPQGTQPEGLQAESSPPAKLRPDASTLIAESFQVAALASQLKRRMQKEASRPRRKFISASTRAYKYAAYMEAWRAKVERVGNFNYPEEARRRSLTGELILEVSLNADGTVHNIMLRRSSGHAALDEAAVRIVRLAAPYAPFPESFRKETDILHITRTWQFLDRQGFR